MIIQELLTEIGFSFDEQGLKKAEEGFKNIKHAMLEIGVAAGSALVLHEVSQIVTETTAAAESLSRMASAFGIGTQQLQVFREAAEAAGVDMGQMQGALGRLSLGVSEAAGGSKEAEKKFTSLGLSLYDAQGQIKPVNDLFLEAADKIKAIENPTKRAGLAMQIFGRSGAQLIPLLQKGSEGILEEQKDLEHLGSVMSGDFIADSKKFREEQRRHKQAMEGLHMAITKAVLPAFTFLEHAWAESIGWINRVVANTNYLRTLFISLGAIMVVLAIKAALPFLPYIGMAALAIAGTLLLVAVIEDLWSLITGGPSLIGDLSKAWAVWIDDFTKPHAGDNWFMTLLRSFLHGLMDLQGTAETVVAAVQTAFAGLFSWLGDKFKAVGAALYGVLPDSVAKFIIGSGAPSRSGSDFLPDGPRRSVGALSGPGGSGVVNSAPTIAMTINAGSADPNAVAVEARRHIDAALESHAQDMRSALVPRLAH